MVLKKEELINITGGGVLKKSFWVIAGGLVTLLVGIIDGYLRPLTCNK